MRYPLEFVRDKADEVAVVDASVLLPRMTPPLWILLLVLAAALTALAMLSGSGSAGSGWVWGLIIGNLMIASWFRGLSMRAKVSRDAVIIETLFRGTVRSVQQLDGSIGRRFALRPSPRFLGMLFHPTCALYFGEQRVRLPLIFRRRAQALSDEWNALLDAVETRLSSA